MTQRLTEKEIAEFGEALRRSRTESAQDSAIIDDILDALDRIDEGTYGRCQLCREWLPKERLAAVPWVRRCAACEARRSGAANDSGRSTGAG